ncbi:MAG: cell division protein SepF [Nanoarchaeota archaeon]
MVWDAFKKKLSAVMSSESKVELGEDYVELEAELKDPKAKVLIRPFTLNKYDDIKQILAAIREGSTISILNIAPLKEKDVSELKRAIDKLKKTIEANEGDIAGFGENWLIATPSFAKVWRQSEETTTPLPVNDDLED